MVGYAARTLCVLMIDYVIVGTRSVPYLSDRIKSIGPNLGEPHTEAFGNGLFELRLKGSEGIARVFYCTMIDRRIVMLHSFIKKTQKTPPKDRRLAETRMQEIKHADIR